MRTYKLVPKPCWATCARVAAAKGLHPAQSGAKIRLAAFILCCGGALGAHFSISANEVQSANSRQTMSSSRSALGLAVVIPTVLQIQENRHPLFLTSTAAPGSRISATQDIVLLTTLRRGFCVDLQLTNLQLVDWQLTVSGSTGTSIEPAGSGYRLCLARAGRYKLALQHSFSPNIRPDGASTAATEFVWPVGISLSTP